MAHARPLPCVLNLQPSTRPPLVFRAPPHASPVSHPLLLRSSLHVLLSTPTQVAAVTCTEVEKVASIPSEIADVDGFSFLGIEAVATDKAAHQLQHTSALEVAAKVATSASVAVGAMNNCQNCVYVRRVCACMGRERCLYGYGQSRGEQRRSSRSLCLVFAARPRVRVFAPRRLMRWLPLASLPGASLPSTSRLPTCHKPSTMRCWSVCESVAPCTHPQTLAPVLYLTLPFRVTTTQTHASLPARTGSRAHQAGVPVPVAEYLCRDFLEGGRGGRGEAVRGGKLQSRNSAMYTTRV